MGRKKDLRKVIELLIEVLNNKKTKKKSPKKVLITEEEVKVETNPIINDVVRIKEIMDKMDEIRPSDSIPEPIRKVLVDYKDKFEEDLLEIKNIDEGQILTEGTE
jgi:hypothetical protein